MSSDALYNSIDEADLNLIRGVLSRSGFSAQEPMSKIDRDSARYLIARFQQGIRNADDLQFALRHRGECEVMAHHMPGNGGMSA